MRRLTALLLALLCLVGCGAKTETEENRPDSEPATALSLMEQYNDLEAAEPMAGGRSIYEVFVYSFCDSDGDGIGDLKGLESKLDYIQELGYNGLWLMPIHPSPTYHKYDVMDYYAIDPDYGTMEDFRSLVDACHSRGMVVIMDLVLNHTSSQHPWFQAACETLASIPAGEEAVLNADEPVGYYNFSQEKKGSCYPVPGADGWYYEAPFWSEMPDLCLSNEFLRQEIADIAAFWLERGVDGFRLDAAKEFVTGNTEANVEILTWFHDTVTALKGDEVILVAEVWQDMTGYSKYYASGVSCFDFAFADKNGIIASAVKDAAPGRYARGLTELKDCLNDPYPQLADAPFFTNHDLGRCAGYFAGDQSMSQVKLAHALNLTMSGNAFTYYGEELGMKGAGKDENKRAPMQWGAEEGLCQGPKDMDSIQMKFGTLEEQMADENSIYHYFRQLLRLRNAYPAIACGQLVSVESTDQLCIVTKAWEGEELTLVYNFTAEPQSYETELTVAGALLVDGADLALEAQQLTLPGYGIAVLK